MSNNPENCGQCKPVSRKKPDPACRNIRLEQARKMLQTVWNMGFIELSFLCARYPSRPALTDIECKQLAIYFPWTWMSIRQIFPREDERIHHAPANKLPI